MVILIDLSGVTNGGRFDFKSTNHDVGANPSSWQDFAHDFPTRNSIAMFDGSTTSTNGSPKSARLHRFPRDSKASGIWGEETC